MKRAVIYIRVSTDEQARNGLSLQGQEEAAREYCAREGIEIVGLYCDSGESAKTANRPQLIKSIAFCTENFQDVDYYIVWKLDRLARSAYDTAMIDATLQKLGISLVSVTEPIADTPVGSLTKNMLAGFAQFDNDVRAERSTAGLKRRIEEGGWPHMSPLGFVNHQDALKRPTLLQTEVAPKIGEWLREYLKGGYSLRHMNKLAWDMGILSKAGKRLSYQQTINMLRNPVYAGYVYSKMLDAPRKGLHEGVITVEEHEAILCKLENRKNAKHSVLASKNWPLRGRFLKCADCGSSITGSEPKGRGKKYPIYHCPKCRAKVVGHRVSVPQAQLHHEFEVLLSDVTPSEATLKLFRAQVVKKWQEVSKEDTRQRRVLQKDLETLRDRKQRILSLFIDGKLTSEEKRVQTNLVNEEILRTELKLNERKENEVRTDVLIDFGINMIQNAPKLWRIANELERQRLQTAIFPEGLTYAFEKGFGNGKTGDLYLLISTQQDQIDKVVGVDGIEPSTKRL